jgi:hypothetical protein
MAKKNYFEVKSSGFNKELQREEIQINCGENGMLMIVKTDEGFVVDAFDIDGENIDSMAVWEDSINAIDEDDEPTEAEVKAYLKEWGQKQGEITSNLGYPRSHAKSDDLLMEDYFFLEGRKEWYPKISRMYSEREQQIADYVDDNRDNY